MRRIRIRCFAACLLISLSMVCVLAHAQSNSAGKTTASASTSKTSSASAPSETEIATAKSAGKVWVNLTSGVYHKGGRWYGKTKNGQFMSEDEAKKAGYKPAHRD